MRISALCTALAAATLVSGCTASPASEVAVSAPPDPDVLAMGEDAFQRCSGCHSVTLDGPSRAGPNLHGLVGQVAGTQPGFPYTDALDGSGIVWDAATLDAFLADPSGTVPGSEMRRGTVRDADQRAAIVVYLASLRAE